MATGKIVRFDRMRGYGFIAPDAGGEDVFVHANELEAEGASATVGSRVGFEVVEGERGLKAYDVRLLSKEAAPVAPANGSAPSAVNGSVANGTRTVVATPHGASHGSSDDDEEWDVLGEREFVGEVTELLITASPALTASQIMEIRHALVGMARSRGWVD